MPTGLNTEDTKNHEGPRRGVSESDDETAQAVLQPDGVEIHQQADADVAHAQVGQDLGIVRRQQRRDGLDFDDNGVRHRMSARKPRGKVLPLYVTGTPA